MVRFRNTTNSIYAMKCKFDLNYQCVFGVDLEHFSITSGFCLIQPVSVLDGEISGKRIIDKGRA